MRSPLNKSSISCNKSGMGHIRKLSSVAFFVVLISSIGLVNVPYMPQASAHGIVDLDQPIFDSSEPINDGFPSGTLNDAQRIFPTATGDLLAVDITVVSPLGNPPGDMIVRIYDSTISLVASESIAFSTLPMPPLVPANFHVDFTTPPALIAGNEYFIDVSTSVSTDVQWHFHNADQIAGNGIFNSSNQPLRDFQFTTYMSGIAAGPPTLTASVNILPECSVNTNGDADFGSLSPGFPSSEEQLDLLVQGSADADIHYSGDHWFGFPPTVPIMNVFTTAFDLIGGTTHAAKIPFPHVSDPIPAPGNVGIIISPATQLTFLQNLPFLLDLSFSGFLTQDLFVTFTCVIDFLSMTGSPASGPVSTPVGGMTSIEIRDYQGIVDPTSIAIITISIEQDSTGGVAVLTCAVCINGVATLPAAAAGTVLVPIDLLISTPGTFTLIAQSESIIPFETASFTLS